MFCYDFVSRTSLNTKIEILDFECKNWIYVIILIKIMHKIHSCCIEYYSTLCIFSWVKVMSGGGVRPKTFFPCKKWRFPTRLCIQNMAPQMLKTILFGTRETYRYYFVNSDPPNCTNFRKFRLFQRTFKDELLK